MQQRFAFALLVRLDQTTAPGGAPITTLHGTVQAADAPEATHFSSLRQLRQWFEYVLTPHISPQAISNISEPTQ